MIKLQLRRTMASAAVIGALLYSAQLMGADRSTELKGRSAQAAKSLTDMQATMVVTSINKNNAEDINPAFSDIGQFQKAKVYFKRPDKYRAEGVARGMAVAYVENSGRLQIVIPGVLKKTEDVSNKAGKRRTTLDMGFITDTLWRDNYVSFQGIDGKAAKLKLVPKREGTRRYELVWIDPISTKLIKRQRYNSGGELRAVYVYNKYKNVGKLPIAQQARIYAPNGKFVGTVEYRDVKTNTHLKDSLFKL